MEVLIEHLGGVQFEIKAREHVIVSDQPSESGGYDEGMTPPELLLASLGSCAGFYAAQYLRKHALATEGTRVRVTAEKTPNPARVDNFRIEVEVPGGLRGPSPRRPRGRSPSLSDPQYVVAPAEHRAGNPQPGAHSLLDATPSLFESLVP